LLRDHLNPGGLAVTWAPTPRILRTFLKIFPYVLQHGQVVMGSDAPILIDRPAIGERLNTSHATSHFGWAGVDIRALLRPYTIGGWKSFGPTADRSMPGDINTDLHPRDEFDIPPVVDLRWFGFSP
jgi:hypothetical protein